MSRRRFNWPVAIVILIALVVIVTTAFTLRKWQRNRMASSVFEAGLLAYEGRDWENAAINLGRYLVIDPANAEILFKYAQSQLNRRPLKRNHVKQAVASYRIILRNNKDNLEAAKKLANLYLQMNVAPEAELIAERYLENNNDSDMQLIMAVAFARQRKLEQSFELLHEIIEKDTGKIEAYRALGELSMEFPGEFEQSSDYWFDLAIEKNPTDMKAYISRAEFYLRDKKETLALKDIEKAEALIAQDEDITLDIVKVFIKAKLFGKARKCLLVLRGKDKSDLNLWQRWGVLALLSDNEDDMAMVAEEGLRNLYDPERWDFMPLAAELLVNSNRFELADKCIKQLKQKDISPIETVFVEGLLARRQSQDYKAIKLWKKAIEMGDVSEKIYLSIAMALADVGDKQSAIMQLNKMILKIPGSFKGHLFLAMLMSQSGDFDRALEHSLLAMQIMPGNLESTLLNLQIKMELMKLQQFGIDGDSWLEIERKLSKIAEIAEGSVEAKLTQVKLAIYLEKYAQAENMVKDLKKNHPHRMDVAVSEIDLLIAQQETDRAISKLYSAIEVFPEESVFVFRLAWLFAKGERIGDCQILLNDAIGESKSLRDKRRLVFMLAQYYENWDEPEKAFNLLDDLSAQLPSDIPLKIELLKNLRVLGKDQQVEKILDEIKAIESEQGWQWRCLQVGLWLEAEDFMSRYIQMINMMKENILTNPTDQISRLLLAKTYEKAGKLQLAITTYRDALNRSPKDIRIIIPAVVAMYKAGEYGQAGEILDYAMMSEDLKQKLTKFKLQNCIGEGDYALAEDILNELLIQAPDDLTMNLFFCWLKIRQGQLGEASEILENLTDEQKGTFSACVAMVNLSLLQGDEEKAINISNEIVERFGNASAYMLRAKTYSLLGENGLAMKNLNMAGEVEPENVNVWISKSYLSLALGDYGVAVKSMEKALRLMPDDIQVKKQMVKVLLSCESRKDHVRGLEILENCLSENPEDVQLRLYKAQHLLSKNTVPANRQAHDILRAATEQSPRNFHIWAVLAESYLRAGQSGLAMESILKALSFSPGNRTLLILKAKIEAVHMPQLAIYTLKLLEQQHSGDISITLTLAEMYGDLGDFSQAIKILQNYPVSNAYPQDKIIIKIALAKALYKNNQIKQATELLDLLSESTDDGLKIFLVRFEILIEEMDAQSFSKNLSIKFEQNLDKIDVFVDFAQNLSLLNSSKANKIAEEVLLMVLKEGRQSYKAKCMLADLLMFDGRQEQAVCLYREILKDVTNRGLSYAPDYVDLIDTHGYILLKSGQIQKAIDDFNKCIDLYPPNSKLLAVSYLHLADALAELRQNGKAIENLKAALKLNSTVGGLSAIETSKAQELIAKLSQETDYDKITK